MYTRTQILLDTNSKVIEFVKNINSDGTTNKYILEDFSAENRVSARSYLGALYASAEFGDHIFLVNMTEDGVFPNFVREFQV